MLETRVKQAAAIAAVLLCAGLAALFIGYSLFPAVRETRFQAAGVSDNGEGVIIDFALRSRPGNGALLVNVANAEWREDTAASFLAAREHAQSLVGVPLDNRDYELSVSASGAGIGGESAGAAFASAVIANYYGGQLRGDAVVSAALPLDAANETLEPIGGADEKILAAAKAGKRFFVVAQAQQLKYEGELAKRIAIKRVRTLREAVSFLLQRTG